MADIYFRFLQFSLGLYDGKEFLSGETLGNFDWNAFYRFAKKQTLTGVIFEGIQRLPKKYAPDQALLMNWFGQSQRIYQRNLLLNEAASDIYNNIKTEGFRCCILKGQGNALMYPNPFSRTPGDIDIWVRAERDDIRMLAQQLTKDNGCVGKESLNHIELMINDIAVELHSTPAILNNSLYNHRLQKWLKRNADLQCSNIVALPNDAGEIAVPTCAFNVIYQLLHLYHHYFYEGVGLRQIVDYYFVVISDELLVIRDTLQRELKHLGLWKFAGAVMYVLHETLGLSEEKMIAPMDKKRGKLLLAEILNGGNFGQYDERYGFGHSSFGHNMQRLCRDLRLMRYYPAEALSEPIFRTWHFFWRIHNKRS
ncbi:nucleotidyltransferase family protein [uncultured Prevotella sp.]|uniref:nucleotidyltransferase domain-containing protein n=1 Tax=uncultured Prevotella sp. TaxID=159272 RepID=UPI00262CEB77|nr:nucleotidyltransferase family protein [uncultured Prevotella sp.]